MEFGATRALESVSARIVPGEIVGLLGHNGAGKSTLFNVVSGVFPASSGDFLIDGIHVGARSTPMDMARLGVTVIHQEPALAPNLSIIDNLFLGQSDLYPKDRTGAAHRALARVGAALDLDLIVGTLSLGERQLVDLARGMLRGEMKILLLDEPTAALGRTETVALHRLIRNLAAEGVTVIYVSHRLPDILDVCQRILVLRSGRLEVDGPASQFDGQTLAKALAPDAKVNGFAAARTAGPESIGCEQPDAAISCRAGEVVGLFGMAAGEQFRLLESIFGLHRRFGFRLGGRRVAVASPAQAIRHGIHLVPADRENDGLISGASALDTVFLPWYRDGNHRGFWIGPKAGRQVYARARAALNILGPGSSAPIDEFSGGNRQKHLISRWMFPRLPRVLLLAQPTQGVDVGAKADIAQAVRALAAEGATVLVASAESDEIDLLCDRAYVMNGGRIAPVDRTTGFGGKLLSALLELSDRKSSKEEVA
ncbi:sugar ABC transporter ATP-binding protein [Arthrobacter sp. I2-34]|uniref:Sugar ABC transporter ATP-binding protein n=1 Tax=Arthrobacter hankyongi TaxID=2904801 RepID=A0ABS9LEE4_9MICC|nr:sugar ABC transporter ATP-binding protein [Arthrobacter hankyongi]MCG2624817.1 sugar ABC transporter ATP-binding protein [Arthrobacter hankyongi]